MIQEDRMSVLARDILQLSRNTLLVKLRFLDSALSRLKFAPTGELTLATDGQRLVYDPGFIIQQYKIGQGICVRDYLHVIMHCIFRHMYIHTLVDSQYWDLACDIAVESVILDLDLQVGVIKQEAERQAHLGKLLHEIGQITAEKVYRHLLSQKPSSLELERLCALFRADDHSLWYKSEGEGLGNSKAQASWLSGAMTEADWTQVSARVQMELEIFQKEKKPR